MAKGSIAQAIHQGDPDHDGRPDHHGPNDEIQEESKDDPRSR
jgi:hypothetical protein